jgi:hypothetical protein
MALVRYFPGIRFHGKLLFLTGLPFYQPLLQPGSIHMGTQYDELITDHLRQLFRHLPEGIDEDLPARREGTHFHFRAFGEDCTLGPEQIALSGTPETGPKGLLISLYALEANPEPIKLAPFQSFKDLPGSMPYHGAFTANAEIPLIPHVSKMRQKHRLLLEVFAGEENPAGGAGDFSLLLYPLPKIALCYVFYMEDEEFPPAASCLFSANALSFMPLDGLADVGEYTTRKIISLIQENG